MGSATCAVPALGLGSGLGTAHIPAGLSQPCDRDPAGARLQQSSQKPEPALSPVPARGSAGAAAQHLAAKEEDFPSPGAPTPPKGGSDAPKSPSGASAPPESHCHLAFHGLCRSQAPEGLPIPLHFVWH